VAQPQPPVLAQQQQPGAERAGYARGEQAAARDEVEPERLVGLQGRPGRGRTLPADHKRLPAPRVEADHRYLTARAVQVRLDNLQHKTRGDRRVEGVAAGLQGRQACRGGQPVRGRDHPERPRELWPSGELGDPGHNAAPSA